MAEAQDTPAFDLAKIGSFSPHAIRLELRSRSLSLLLSKSIVLDQVDPDVVTVNAGASDQLVEVLQARCLSRASIFGALSKLRSDRPRALQAARTTARSRSDRNLVRRSS
jgi:hypothetical protein